MLSPVQQIESLYQRLERARQLAVHPIVGQEGHYAVEASKGGFYLVNGGCSCQDAQHRIELHHGWCKHKLAVELFKESPPSETQAKKASEVLEVEIAELYSWGEASCSKTMGWKPGPNIVATGICQTCYEVEISKIKSVPYN